MSKKNRDKNKKLKVETIEDKWKYEIASELGLLDKVLSNGWGALTAKETGRIGGLITVKKKKIKKMQEENKKNEESVQEG